MLLVAWLVFGPRKRRGWDLRAVLRSWSASWRWSERISGEQWRRFRRLWAISFSALDTSAASRMHGSLKRARTVLGVCSFKNINKLYESKL